MEQVDFQPTWYHQLRYQLGIRPDEYIDVPRRFDDDERFRRASLKGWNYALRRKEEVIKRLQDHYGVNRSTERLRDEAEEIERMMLPEWVEIGHLHMDRPERIAVVYRREGMADPESNLVGTDYREYLPSGGKSPPWLWWLASLAVGTSITVMLLYAINRRLNRRVEERTRELKAAKENLQHYVDIVDRYVITSHTDRNGMITYASDAFCRVSQYSKEELIGRPHRIVRHPDLPSSLFKDLWDTIRQGKSWRGEIMNRAKDGSAYWVDVNIDPQGDREGHIVGYTAVRRDITDKKIIENISIMDRLTQLYNRLKLDDSLAYETTRALRYETPLPIILIDVDRFKRINDENGHLAGDQVLKAIAGLIRSDTRTADIAGRWGGEEFLIICPSTDLNGAHQVAEKLRRRFEHQEIAPVGNITCSLGVAMLVAGESTDDLIGRADKALYQAKQRGRNRVELVA